MGYQERYRIGQDVVVGVNAFQEEDIEVPDLLRVDPESERLQVGRLQEFKANRDLEPPSAACRSCATPPPAARTCSPSSARR